MFLDFARAVANILGHPLCFIISLISIVLWAVLGPYYHYDADWQLVINTTTTIITFLCVIILQHSGNHDAKAVDNKLNEIIALLNRDKLTSEECKILDEHHEEIIEKAICKAKIENDEAALEEQDIND